VIEPEDTPLMTEVLTESGHAPVGLQELEQVRLILEGRSVVDWRRLAFRDRARAERFLTLNGFDPSADADRAHLRYLHDTSLEYLVEALGLPEVRTPLNEGGDMVDLLFAASDDGPGQREAMVLFKVMHILHHATGRELAARLPSPSRELFHRVETRVYDAVDGLKSSGIQVAEFSGSRKTRSSVLTKLLCRTDTVAAEIHDRLRFRVVTETLSDLFGALVYLTSELFPFNYVVPGASRNDLIDFAGTVEGNPHLSGLIGHLQRPLVEAEAEATPLNEWNQPNEFSGSSYKMINFVVDMPVRVADLAEEIEGWRPEEDGAAVFVLAEFQLVDRATHQRNDEGENRHALYKARQQQRAIERLLNGR
jgi:uncharacterized protein (TIGR04552 family)